MGVWSPVGHDASKQLKLLLLGPRRSGKSSSGNTLLGQGPLFDTRGGGASTAASSITAGYHVTVVDAQRWGSSEGSVPRQEKIELLRALDLCTPDGPHVVLLVIPLLDFTESERRAVERRMEVLTPMVWRHTMVLFTCGDQLRRHGSGVREHIQAGGAPLSWLMEKCRYRYHVFDNRTGASARTSVRREVGFQEAKRSRSDDQGAAPRNGGGEQQQVRELLSKVEDLLLENGSWHFSLHMYQRMEEEWSRRETQLRARLEAEARVRRVSGKQKTAEEKINMEPEEELRSETEEEEECALKLERQSSGEEEGEDPDCVSRAEETRIPGHCRPNAGQRPAFGPIRGLA